MLRGFHNKNGGDVIVRERNHVALHRLLAGPPGTVLLSRWLPPCQVELSEWFTESPYYSAILYGIEPIWPFRGSSGLIGDFLRCILPVLGFGFTLHT